MVRFVVFLPAALQLALLLADGPRLSVATDKAGEEFLASKATDENVKPLGDSGILYKVLHEGEGVENPARYTKTEVKFTGMLIDGTEFSSGEAEWQPNKSPIKDKRTLKKKQANARNNAGKSKQSKLEKLVFWIIAILLEHWRALMRLTLESLTFMISATTATTNPSICKSLNIKPLNK